MSEVKKSDLTAGGDVSVVETIKIECTDGIDSRSITKSIITDVTVKNAAAEEVATSTLNAQAETESSIEATNSANAIDEKVADPDARTAETTNTVAEDVSVGQIDAQEHAAEIKNLIAVTPQSEETPQTKSANEEKSKQNARGNNATCISKLEAEMRKRTKERDSYRKMLEDTETKLTALQASYDAITSQNGNEDTLQRSVEQLRGQLAQTALMCEERNRVIANQESQINALNHQVTSLKEVVSITRDLLQIRNIEVKQLQAEVDNMERKITEERDRHNTMISKMDTAMRLNADLKKEYETQLSLFQSLREKYGEKITLLSGEKRALETAASAPE